MELEPQARGTPALLSSIFGVVYLSLASHLTGKSPAGPREPQPSDLPQPRGKVRGLGSCWRDVPAHFGSISREKALGGLGSSYLHGTIRKKTSLDPMRSPWLQGGDNSWWRAGGAREFLMFSSCSSHPWCSHTVPVPSLQTPSQLLARGLHILNKPLQTKPTAQRSTQWFKQ